VRWTGGPVDRLLATGVFENDYFTLNVVLKFASKGMGCMQFNGLIKTDWQETLVIHGTRGSLHLKMFFPYLDSPTNAVFVSHELGSQISPFVVVNTMYEDELRYFLNCITEGFEPEPNGYQALEAQKIIIAIEQSLKLENWVDIE
jgi:predicted dehydrogenase